MSAPVSTSLRAALSILIFSLCSVAIAVDTTNVPPLFGYAPVDIRVMDSLTMRPVVGATVIPQCLGGTPYETNSYRTDTNGLVKAIFYENGFVAVRVIKDGYVNSVTALVESTNRVVKLRKVQP